MTLKDLLRPIVPTPVLHACRAVLRKRAEWPLTLLQLRGLGALGFRDRRALVRRVLAVNNHVRCAHTHGEMAQIISEILAFPAEQGGCVVEAGCYKGGSTAKLSIATKLAGRRLVVFDSFEGLPEHQESHGRTIFGQQTGFVRGIYAGRLDEVTQNVRQYGDLEVCDFVKGWFENTMPSFQEPVAVAFVDVDLAASTRTCLQHLYPLLVPGGVIFSHDGHLPLCIEALRDEQSWAAGGPRPIITGLGTRKLVSIRKPPLAGAA